MIAANAFRNSSLDHDGTTHSRVTSVDVRVFEFCVAICSGVLIINVCSLIVFDPLNQRMKDCEGTVNRFHPSSLDLLSPFYSQKVKACQF